MHVHEREREIVDDAIAGMFTVRVLRMYKRRVEKRRQSAALKELIEVLAERCRATSATLFTGFTRDRSQFL